MSNKTIPQLPEQTGKTDNDLLAIVDSGETTTSKIKVSTLLSGVGGAFQVGDATDSIVPSYSPTSRGVAANTLYIDNLDTGGNAQFGGTEVEQSRNNSRASFATSNPFNTTFGFIAGGGGLVNSGARSVVGSGFGTNNSGFGAAVWSYGCDNDADQAGAIGGLNHFLSSAADRSGVIGGNDNEITSTDSVAVGGTLNTISHARSVILGGSGLTSNYDEEVQVPNLTIANYSSLNYADDTAAAAGGVSIGQVYHNAGALRVRIT